MDLYGEYSQEYEQLCVYRVLLVKRDELKKEISMLQETLFLKLGDLQIELFRAQIRLIRLKKELNWIHQKLNTGSVPDPEDMKEEIDRLMESHYEKLNALTGHFYALKTAPVLNDEEVRLLKQRYRQLVRMLHPDLHPEFKARPDIRDLWERVQRAYHGSHLLELDDLFIQAQALIESETQDLYIPSDLPEKIERIREEIEDLRLDHIFQLQFWIDDSQSIDVARQNLKEQIVQHEEYITRLERERERLLGERTWTIH